ncbi:MAG TPA: leucine-rich repeat domain-containing protein [Candidatus Spyradenecus faecavium]|uniref:Leucine-rich repeat domain-containing protein n=1 Tax=Candidatus Spyradenecus faecavium TaxID=2840947 RepID=A0A9D1T2K8_9BACT|nr:leucine-rich repeat domain-containing protein [Candidatus Spyradenecus faecavium]
MATGETIAAQIADLNASKAALIAAIAAKGVAVPQGAKLADLAALVSEITTGAQDTCAYDRDTMTSLTIPDGVTKIGTAAFDLCSVLRTLTLPEGLKTIGEIAFSGCHVLQRLKIPGTVTDIGVYAFQSCFGLVELELEEGLKSIPERVFTNCSSLTELVFPEGLRSIGDDAFFGCCSLRRVTIPSTVTSIGLSAFGVSASMSSTVCEFTVPWTMEETKAKKNYPWGHERYIFHCTDGDIKSVLVQAEQ